MQIDKIILTVSYLLIITGSAGMMVFASKFPLASGGIWELKYTLGFLSLNGYQIWISSWFAILLGTAGQILATWCCS